MQVYRLPVSMLIVSQIKVGSFEGVSVTFTVAGDIMKLVSIIRPPRFYAAETLMALPICLQPCQSSLKLCYTLTIQHNTIRSMCMKIRATCTFFRFILHVATSAEYNVKINVPHEVHFDSMVLNLHIFAQISLV